MSDRAKQVADNFVEWAQREGIGDRHDFFEPHFERNGTALISLMDIATGPPDPRATVLGNRFLCIDGSMLFVGPSGIGKSLASVQQDILWSLGREAFGIRPARPLRILTIQAENDAEDLAEMREGVCRGLGLSADERERVRQRVFYESECGRTGQEFLAYVESRLADAIRSAPHRSVSSLPWR
jgi:hypothetical protein